MKMNPDEFAFPSPLTRGLTTRELFAMAAMQGMLACPTNTRFEDGTSTEAGNQGVAKCAVDCADFLIAALNKEAK